MIYLFDIDGTLLLSGGAGARALDRAFAALHGIAGAIDEVRFGGKTDPVIVEEMFRAKLARAATDDEYEALIAADLPLLDEELATSPRFRLMPSVEEALDFLAAQPGVLLAVATGNVRAAAEKKLRRGGLHARFAVGGYACDDRDRARLVARGIERARAGGAVPPDAPIAVVGDTPHDVSAARACGALALAVATGGFTRAELAACEPDALFDTLAELPAWHEKNSRG